jgi:hypothetical protein
MPSVRVCTPAHPFSFEFPKNLYDNNKNNNNDNSNSVALVRERTIPTERPSLVSEVSANVCGYRVSRGQRGGYLRPYSWFSRPEPLFFSSKHLLSCTHEAERTPFQTYYLSENLVAPGIEPWPLDYIGGPKICMILGIYVMEPEFISLVCFKNPSTRSVFLCVFTCRS